MQAKTIIIITIVLVIFLLQFQTYKPIILIVLFKKKNICAHTHSERTGLRTNFVIKKL